jgi:hypothetical protein
VLCVVVDLYFYFKKKIMDFLSQVCSSKFAVFLSTHMTLKIQVQFGLFTSPRPALTRQPQVTKVQSITVLLPINSLEVVRPGSIAVGSGFTEKYAARKG